jgi:hypothetical protein
MGGNKRAVEAPTVIIPPQHQSALQGGFSQWRPKGFRRPKKSDPSQIPVAGPIHRGDEYDTEMDLAEYNDPKVQAQLVEFQKNVMSVSPEQSVEAAMQAFEKNYADERTADQRWEGQQRWQGKDNEAMRLVNIMSPTGFINKLQLAGIDARLDANRNARIWLNNFSKVGRVGVNAWLPDPETKVKVATHITTLQYPLGPEWSLMRFNEYDVPTNERYRGWRTALLALIISNVISEDEARRAFGDPVGPAAEFYRQQLFYYRRIKVGLETKIGA